MRNRFVVFIAINVISTVLSVSRLYAVDVDDSPLSATASVNPPTIPPGSNGQLLLALDLKPGYHAYLDRFSIQIHGAKEFPTGNFEIKPTVEFFDTISKSHKRGVEKQAELRVGFEVPSDHPQNPKAEVFALLTYQACTQEFCLFPKTLRIPLLLGIGAQSILNEVRPNQSIFSLNSTQFEAFLNNRSAWIFFLIFFAGLMTAFTPCIYPMIPITLAVIGTSRKSHRQGFLLSGCYVLGIATTYSLAGYVAAKTGALMGSYLTNPFIIGPIAILFMIMGFSMYGLFEIQAPSFIRDRFANLKTGGGLAGAFSAGLLAGVIAGPCVGPILVSILTFVAQSQDGFLGFLFLFVFSLGMGLPFLLLGTFSHLITRIPRAGRWMTYANFLFGTIMIAMGLYYLQPIVPTSIYSYLLSATFVLTMFYFMLFRSQSRLATAKWQLRIKQGLLFLVVAFLMGLLINQLKDQYKISYPATQSHSPWIPYSETEFLNSLNKRPFIIDFRADWCAACIELEEKTFSDSEVLQLGRQFTLFRIDATNESALVNQLKKRYNVLGLPTILFLDPQGQVWSELTLTGFEDPRDFVKRMEQALQKLASPK